MGVKGLDEILRANGAAVARLTDAAGVGLYAAGNRVMTTAKSGLVPVDHGTLRGSGYVTEPVKEGEASVIVELGFGGPAADYAVIQHEEQSFAHEVGTFKYLEKATQQEADAVPRIVAEYGAAALASGRKVTLPQGGQPRTPFQHAEAAAREAAAKARDDLRAKAKAERAEAKEHRARERARARAEAAERRRDRAIDRRIARREREEE